MSVSESAIAPEAGRNVHEDRVTCKEGTRSPLEIAAPLGVPLMAVLVIAFFSLDTSGFLTGSNIQNIFADAALPGLLAVGLTIPLVMGDFDISFAAMAGLSSTLFASLVSLHNTAPAVAIVVTLLCGLAVGVLNGGIVAFIGINAFVATIAMQSILIGWEFPLTGSTNIYTGFPQALVTFTRGNTGPVPNLVIVAAVIVAILWVLLEKTVFGRHVKAVGGNREAAHLTGVNVKRTRAIGFVIVALTATVAGILYVNKQAVSYPLSGLESQLLPAFTAAFIGAATFRLGEFNILGTVVGALLVTITSQGLILEGAGPNAQYIFQGLILLVALLFARVISFRREG